ncbi:MAG: OsmC family protein [Fidelibacterota bacterium]
MDRFNNVNLRALQIMTEEFEKDPSKARKTQVIEGEWLMEEGGPQFRAKISYEGGEATFETDQPTNLGGGGNYPGPMHYCFTGLASCYTSTFATVASMLGVKLKKLSCRVETDLNFSRVFGLSDDPVMEEVRVTLTVSSDDPPEKIKEAEDLAMKRCPVVFSLTTPIKLTPQLEIL